MFKVASSLKYETLEFHVCLFSCWFNCLTFLFIYVSLCTSFVYSRWIWCRPKGFSSQNGSTGSCTSARIFPAVFDGRSSVICPGETFAQNKKKSGRIGRFITAPWSRCLVENVWLVFDTLFHSKTLVSFRWIFVLLELLFVECFTKTCLEAWSCWAQDVRI